MLFGIYTNFIIPSLISCTMLKLPQCRKYDAEFSVGSVNKKLEHGFLSELMPATILDCYINCTYHKDCYSVNYNKGFKKCELLNMEYIHGYNPTFSLAAGWVHVQTRHKMKIGPKCESGDFCSTGLQCRDTCSPPHYYECVDQNVSLYDLAINYLNVSESSSLIQFGGPEAPFDGIFAGFPACTHTSDSENPWWKVTFKHKVMVHDVEIWNRDDCCKERLNDADIFVFSGLGENLCTNMGIMTNVVTKLFNCSQLLSGDGLIIRGVDNALTLCEVQVYGKIL